jgi:two-component system response regulator (stage 0 sporulation protein F)
MKKILVVDDSVTSRALFRAFVPANGKFELFEAANHDEALELFKKIKPDICVLDYNLPGKNGIEIAKSLIETNIPTKFVLMTANTQKIILDEAKKLNFVAMIEKPLDSDTVANVLGGIL